MKVVPNRRLNIEIRMVRDFGENLIKNTLIKSQQNDSMRRFATIKF